ncbi:MAG: restriction endonuclease [Kiritimatiellia bacterium]
MKINYSDYNGVGQIISKVWPGLNAAFKKLKLHVKGSDQAGIQGNLIFDPVGTNETLKKLLVPKGWKSGVPIRQLKAFGINIDFEKQGVILECQFSNYPFLMNNVARSHVFSKQGIKFNGHVPKALIVVTKCKVFPASNSTLYYEQGKAQLDALAQLGAFDLPIRLVGLSEDVGSRVRCMHTNYSAARYSRTVVKAKEKECVVEASGARARLRFA